MSMLSLSVLLLLPGILFCTPEVPTYEYQDRKTGEILQCKRCEPGTYLTAHCTAAKDTQCAPCQTGHYTELWNYLNRCLYCNNFCSQNQEVEIECSPITNRVCRCKAGFYMMEDFCVRHTECGPGHGVQAIGTPTEDTVCEKCQKGYFSSSSSASNQCVKHQACLGEQVILLRGSAFHDTVCGTCQSLANGGDDLRAVLSASFTGSRIPRRDLKRLIHKIIHKNQEDDCTGDSALPKQRGPLVDVIRAWLAQASAEQLKMLAKSMRDSQFSSIGTKLESILDEIKQQDPTCSL
ncbi:tumor necrosis factor receptor superfamily member 6B-like [Xiphophorus couchianus]|uniref:tumor necrosis factor receptor superfamily member 6B-like n=1 Tax=Xiphophorus couchianus TaxID=32473 RepID=UPI00101676C3|nr:tumor necrosis factor receptor superfamily member 6B-like [Xiphophorus couchianus]